MASIIREVTIDAPAAQCWDALRAFDALHGPLHSEHYNASAQIVPDGAQRCRFVWSIDVLPDELASRTAELMDAGLRAISATLSGGTAGPPEPQP